MSSPWSRRSASCCGSTRAHAALERWAADDLRSINGQIEFVLKEALRTAGRLKERATDPYRTSEDDE
ncbi:hypothetical protein OV079_09945 [Nannocystis pusilla]|uniref:Arc-like DNA binding domain-containing protein n=1 Tax=Nannocystis pusilla TaxID=889268 RepID=A0A9X3EKR6_9BACT|nr:hypothetical protein [Nannocystis pusilla]MCY1005884.1 hypothetical protein [Nannocystis pusilla]